MSTIINATTTNGVVIQPDNSGSLQLATNSGTTAVTIDTSQNVGIGTTTLTSAKTTIYCASGSSDVGVTGNAMYLNVATPATTGNYIRFAGAVTTDLYYGRAVNSDAFVWGKVGGAESMRIDSSGNLLFNSGYGSVATAYGCRAWVNFNGTGTVAIRASGNVTSITDNGTGDYTVNFTNAMPDANYCSVLGGQDSAIANSILLTQAGTRTTTQLQIGQRQLSGAQIDLSQMQVAIFR